MHLRFGFVSNSSSSSFVLDFHRDINSAEDLCKILNWDSFKKAIEDEFEVLDLEEDINREYIKRMKRVDKYYISQMIFHVIEGFRGQLEEGVTFDGKPIGNQKHLFNHMFWTSGDYMSFKEVMKSFNEKRMENLDFFTIGNDAYYPCKFRDFEEYFLYKYEYAVPYLFEGIDHYEQDQH